MTREAKRKAKQLIIERINNFKPESETMEGVLDEVVDGMWDIFEDDVLFHTVHNKIVVKTTRVNTTIQCKGGVDGK